jgi:hypothetical protein
MLVKKKGLAFLVCLECDHMYKRVVKESRSMVQGSLDRVVGQWTITTFFIPAFVVQSRCKYIEVHGLIPVCGVNDAGLITLTRSC